MTIKKIIKNLTGSTYQIINRDIANNSSYDIDQSFWLELSNDTSIHDLISAGTLVMNDGSIDLPESVGVAHAESITGVVKHHGDITLLSSIGENAPAVVKISNAVVGFEMEINDEIYGQSRVDNYAGGDVKIQIHMAINNTVADRWIQFEVSYWTTNGLNDKNADIVTDTLIMGPIEVPTTAYRIFETSVSVPSSAFSSNEKYIFIGIKRVVATGKTAPANNPTIFRYCKEYYEKPEA